MKAVDETLELCAEIPGVELWHVTPQPGTGSPIAARTFERVTISEMSEIYSQVDVLVKLSRVEGMFAPPLEAFRSGATAIVSKVTGYDEYITNGENALVVEVDDFDSARESIIELRDNQILLNKLQAKALETSKEWPSIRETGQKFVTICATVLAMRENQQECKRELRAARKHVNGAFRHREDPRSAYPPQLFVNSPRT